MLAAADKAGVQLGVVSQRRFFEPVRRMRAAIDAGKIGRPVLGMFLMLSWRDEAYYRSDPWRGRWDTEGGGVLVNQSPHQFDLLQWFMGPIEEISGYWANLNHPSIEVDDTAVAVIRFKSGGLGSIVTSVSQKPGVYTKVHVHGSNGASVGVQTDGGATFIAGMTGMAEPPFNDVWTVPGEEALLAGWQAEDRERFGRVDPVVHYHALQDRDFLQAVLEGREPLTTGRDGRVVVADVHGDLPVEPGAAGGADWRSWASGWREPAYCRCATCQSISPRRFTGQIQAAVLHYGRGIGMIARFPESEVHLLYVDDRKVSPADTPGTSGSPRRSRLGG